MTKPAKKTKQPIPDIPIHPAANLFPMMTDNELAALAEDIAERRQQVPIALLNGQILDGRNRFKACQLKGIYKPVCIDVKTDDPVGFVLSANLHRRQLDDNQRAMIAAKLASLPRGRPGENPPNGGISAAQAAQRLNVSERTLERAKKVLRAAVTEVVVAVEKGEASISAAEEFAKQTKKDQAEQIAAAGTAAKAVEQLVRVTFSEPQNSPAPSKILSAEDLEAMEADARARDVQLAAARAEQKPAPEWSKSSIKAAADRAEQRSTPIPPPPSAERLAVAFEVKTALAKTIMDKATPKPPTLAETRAIYVAAAKKSCSTDAKWETEIVSVTDMLRAAQKSRATH